MKRNCKMISQAKGKGKQKSIWGKISVANLQLIENLLPSFNLANRFVVAGFSRIANFGEIICTHAILYRFSLFWHLCCRRSHLCLVIKGLNCSKTKICKKQTRKHGYFKTIAADGRFSLERKMRTEQNQANTPRENAKLISCKIFLHFLAPIFRLAIGMMFFCVSALIGGAWQLHLYKTRWKIQNRAMNGKISFAFVWKNSKIKTNRRALLQLKHCWNADGNWLAQPV